MRRLVVALATLVAVLVTHHDGLALEVPDRPHDPLVDYASTLSAAERAQISTQLRSYTRHIAIAVFPSLEGEAPEAFGIRVADKWGIGGKRDSDGVLVLVFMREHKVRIEVGYGVEDKLTDLESSRIIREEMAPQMRQGHVAAALLGAATAIHELTDPAPSQAPKIEPKVADLPWMKPHAHADDATDPRIYDFSGELEAEEKAALESVARELEAGRKEHYLVAVFPARSPAADAVVDELARRWSIEKGRVVMFCSYLDSVMTERISPALQTKLDDDMLGRIIQERIRPFYAADDIAGGLQSGLYAADSVVSGRVHPIASPKPAPQQEPPPPVATEPPRPHAWYLFRAFDDDLARRLMNAPAPLRALIITLLLPMALVAYVPPFIVFFLLAGIFVAINYWAKNARTKQTKSGFVMSALGRLLLLWGPFCAAVAWTLSPIWIIFTGIATVCWLAGLFSTSSGRGGSGGGGWSSSDSWTSGSSGSSSSSDFFSGDGGSFGGGGATGDW